MNATDQEKALTLALDLIYDALAKTKAAAIAIREARDDFKGETSLSETNEGGTGTQEEDS